MKICCNSRMAPGETFREKLANLERYGFAGIEVRLPEDEALPQRVMEVEEALASSPLVACSVVVPGPIYMAPLDSDDAKNAKLARVKTALELGARLGVGAFVTPEYRAQSPMPLWDPPKSLTARESDLLFSFLGEAADYAEKVSAIGLLEPINRYETHYYHRLEDVMAVIDRVGSPRLKICADFFHMNIEERDIPSSIERAAGYIAHVQLGDSNRQLPGQGHLDFRSGLAALQRIGYEGGLSLECRIPSDPERELPECVRYLRRCLLES